MSFYDSDRFTKAFRGTVRPFANLVLRYTYVRYASNIQCHHWFNGHMLKRSTIIQNAMQQLDLRPVAPEPAHVDCLEVIEAAHREDFLTGPAVATHHMVLHLFPKDWQSHVNLAESAGS